MGFLDNFNKPVKEREEVMFSERHHAEDKGINGLLEQGCEFEGKLTFEGTVRINGKFAGEIFSEGTLIIGEGAIVDARIEAGSVIIHGAVKGSLQARDRIEMHAPAQVRGEIKTRTLVVDEGVFFEGNCNMGEERLASVSTFSRNMPHQEEFGLASGSELP